MERNDDFTGKSSFFNEKIFVQLCPAHLFYALDLQQFFQGTVAPLFLPESNNLLSSAFANPRNQQQVSKTEVVYFQR